MMEDGVDQNGFGFPRDNSNGHAGGLLNSRRRSEVFVGFNDGALGGGDRFDLSESINNDFIHEASALLITHYGHQGQEGLQLLFDQALQSIISQLRAQPVLLSYQDNPCPHPGAVNAAVTLLGELDDADEIAGAMLGLVLMQSYQIVDYELYFSDLHIKLYGENEYMSPHESTTDATYDLADATTLAPTYDGSTLLSMPLYDRAGGTMAPVYEYASAVGGVAEYAIASSTGAGDYITIGSFDPVYMDAQSVREQQIQLSLGQSSVQYQNVILKIQQYYNDQYHKVVSLASCMAAYGMLKAIRLRSECAVYEQINDALTRHNLASNRDYVEPVAIAVPDLGLSADAQRQLELDTESLLRQLRQPHLRIPDFVRQKIAVAFVCWMFKYYKNDLADGFSVQFGPNKIYLLQRPVSHTGALHDSYGYVVPSQQFGAAYAGRAREDEFAHSVYEYSIAVVHEDNPNNGVLIDYIDAYQAQEGLYYDRIDDASYTKEYDSADAVLLPGYQHVFSVAVDACSVTIDATTSFYEYGTYLSSASALRFVKIIDARIQDALYLVPHAVLGSQEDASLDKIICCACIALFFNYWNHQNASKKKAFRAVASLLILLIISALAAGVYHLMTDSADHDQGQYEDEPIFQSMLASIANQTKNLVNATIAAPVASTSSSEIILPSYNNSTSSISSVTQTVVTATSTTVSSTAALLVSSVASLLNMTSLLATTIAPTIGREAANLSNSSYPLDDLNDTLLTTARSSSNATDDLLLANNASVMFNSSLNLTPAASISTPPMGASTTPIDIITDPADDKAHDTTDDVTSASPVTQEKQSGGVKPATQVSSSTKTSVTTTSITTLSTVAQQAAEPQNCNDCFALPLTAAEKNHCILYHC